MQIIHKDPGQYKRLWVLIFYQGNWELLSHSGSWWKKSQPAWTEGLPALCLPENGTFNNCMFCVCLKLVLEWIVRTVCRMVTAVSGRCNVQHTVVKLVSPVAPCQVCQLIKRSALYLLFDLFDNSYCYLRVNASHYFFVATYDFLFVKPFRLHAQGSCTQVSCFPQSDNQTASRHLSSEHQLPSNWEGNPGT